MSSEGFVTVFTWEKPSRELLAKWDKRTGELTLEDRETGALVLATRNPDAFAAGVRLLGAGACVTYLGWMLVRSGTIP